MAKFTIAVNKELSADKKREFEANNKPTADFLNVIVWGKMAENCSRMIEKGNRVLIDGRIEISKSNDTYYTNIVANSVQFIDFKSKEKENPFEEDFSNVSDDIYKIFVHTNLNRLFTIVSDDDEARTKLMK